MSRTNGALYPSTASAGLGLAVIAGAATARAGAVLIPCSLDSCSLRAAVCLGIHQDGGYCPAEIAEAGVWVGRFCGNGTDGTDGTVFS